jgi:DNA mismatch endonuclease (patch repair protein)
MKKIRSVDTKSEVMLRRIMWSRGYRYRKNFGKLPGNPDIAFTKWKVAVFVDGEYWHGFQWEEKKMRLLKNLHDAHRREYWIRKIEGNMERDRKNTEELQEMGWTVIRFWSKEVTRDVEGCADNICSVLDGLLAETHSNPV